jgi:N-hydroxyarylamine O-acetyltransferase
VFDLDQYLERIGVDGRPGFAEVHRAHVSTIPFENLDPQRGIPISLDEEALVHKLVVQRRGGYCFEHNLLLALALQSLGAQVDLMLARVRYGRATGAVRPRSHLVLRVHGEGRIWHADVGFGVGTLLEPIPFGPGSVHDQSGWRFRVIQEGAELVLQGADRDGWADLYGLVPQPVPRVDVETSNWYASTHPHSPFVTGLVVSRNRADGTRVSLSDWGELALTEWTPTDSRAESIEREQVPRLLEAEFGLGGFGLDADGRLVPRRAG